MLVAADPLIEVEQVDGPHVVTYRCIQFSAGIHNVVVDPGAFSILHLASTLSSGTLAEGSSPFRSWTAAVISVSHCSHKDPNSSPSSYSALKGAKISSSTQSIAWACWWPSWMCWISSPALSTHLPA